MPHQRLSWGGAGTRSGLGSQGAGRSEEGPGQGREDNDRIVTEREGNGRSGLPAVWGPDAWAAGAHRGFLGEFRARPSPRAEQQRLVEAGEPRATADTTLGAAG